MGGGRTDLRQGRFCFISSLSYLDGPDPRFFKSESWAHGQGSGTTVRCQHNGLAAVHALRDGGRGLHAAATTSHSSQLGALDGSSEGSQEGESDITHSPTLSVLSE